MPSVTTFQRARSEEQRAVRAAGDPATPPRRCSPRCPWPTLSLNELSRRVGLAKSNVLRYFESREAVLLELLDAAWREWLDALARAAAAGRRRPSRVAERVEQIAALLARTLVDRPMLCELSSASAAVLEHNVSVEVARRFKRAAFADTVALGTLVRSVVPELDEASAQRFAATTVLVAGSLWAYSRPSAAMLAAYEADPALAAMRLDFGDAVRDLLATLIAGLLARPA